MSLLDLATDLARIAVAPVEIAVDLAGVVVKPVADAAEHIVETVKTLTE